MMMMTISRVCELISFHIIIIIILWERKLLSRYLLTCCRKSAISLLISIHWQIIHSFFALSHSLNWSSKVRQWSERNWRGGKKFAKITWLSYIPDISSHLLFGFREFSPISSMARIMIELHVSSWVLSINHWCDGERGNDQVGMKVRRKFYCKSPSVHQSTLSSSIEWYWMLSVLCMWRELWWHFFGTISWKMWQNADAEGGRT
jgi:hypothetical protein